MPESSLRVYEMQAFITETRTLEAKARLLENNKTSEVNSNDISLDVSDGDTKNEEEELQNISMNIDEDPNGIDTSATRGSRTEESSCNYIGDITATEEEIFFVTGSSYKGTWDALGMAGVGRYVMPNGTIYEGKIFDGMFHGNGSLYWSKNQRLDVVHNRGKLLEHKYTFADDLNYDDVNWKYCSFPDRRFYESTKRGLRPGGRTLRTAKKPTKILPSGCYDTGDGVYDPKTLVITSYDDSTKILRIPGKEECDWIMKHCRKSWSEPTGYRISLIENWSDDPPDLPYNVAMSEDSPDDWWKRLTTFARDFVDDDSQKENLHSLQVPETCLCGEYVILGEPCRCIPASVHSENESQNEKSSENNKSKKSLRKWNKKTFADSFLDYSVGETNIDGLVNASDSEVSAELSLSVSEVSKEKLSSTNFVNNLQKLNSQKVHYDLFFAATKIGSKNVYKELDDPMRHTKMQINNEEKLRGLIEIPFNAMEENINQSKIKQSVIYSQVRIEKSVDSLKEDSFTVSNEEAFRIRNKKAEDVAGEESAAKNSNATRNHSQQYNDSDILVKDTNPLIYTEEIIDKINSEAEMISDNEKKPNSQIHKVDVEKINIDDFSDMSHEEEFESAKDSMYVKKVVEDISKEKNASEEATNRETTLKNDAKAVTISREKFPKATEAEAVNAHRTKTKLLLSKTSIVSQEYRDDVPRATGSMEKESTGQNLPFYRVDADVVTSRDNIVAETSTKLREDIQIESGLENPTEDGILNEKLEQEKSEYYEKADRETVEDESKEPSIIFQISEEISKENEKSVKTEAVEFLLNRFDDTIYGHKNLLDLPAETKKTSSTANFKVWTSNKSFTSSMDELQSISSMKLKSSNEKEIIEIYKKFPQKKTSKNKCSDANVWRLSSAIRDYNSNTKIPCHSCGLQRTTNTITDHRFELNSTVPKKLKPVEYRMKPCDRKPDGQEVLHIASPCRQEYPLKIPAKHDRSTAKRNHLNIREKK